MSDDQMSYRRIFDFLDQVCDIINQKEGIGERGEFRGYYAQLRDYDDEGILLDRDDYLMDFGYARGGASFVIMGDLGVTWEPSRAYTTPCYGVVKLTTPAELAVVLMKFVDLARSGLVPSASDDLAYQQLFDGDLTFEPVIVSDKIDKRRARASKS